MLSPEPTPAPWFRVLEAARKLSPGDRHVFTAAHLVKELGIEGTTDSKASQIASAWMGKFVRWGYARRVGQIAGNGARPNTQYVLTPDGRTCKQRTGKATKLANLVKAVRILQKVKGTRGETSAYTELLRACDEMEA